MCSWFKLSLITLLLSLSFPTESLASSEPGKTFDAGKFVMEEVGDMHDWHIMDIGEHHISLPLPIILYSEHSGFHVFMSSKFHHGKESYKGFAMGGEGAYEGKIIETLDNGEIYAPWDFSITKVVLSMMMGVALLLWTFLTVAKKMQANTGKAPTGIQNAMEPIVTFVRDDIAAPCIGKDKYEKFMPYLLTVFFFILFNNLLGLIPIIPFGANVTGNIAVTMSLAFFSFVVINVNANKLYWKELYNPSVPWWMKYPIPLMPIVELMGLITKPIVLMIRLFANILAGHMVIAVFVALIFVFTSTMGATAGIAISPVTISLSLFIKILDILVSFIQAFVFTLLSALYIGMATSDHH